VGTDITAHLAAIRAGGKTIAVKGCGIDYIYPEQNMKYTGEIVKKGLIISEYPPGTPPKAVHFPIRNRIIAALSDALLVTEGGSQSGSLSTAGLAADFGKDVFVIPPHDIFDKDYQGNIDLLRDGAIAVYNAMDIMVHSKIFVSIILSEAIKLEKYNIEASEEISDIKAVGHINMPDDSYYNTDISVLDDASRQVYELIRSSRGEYNADMIIENLPLDPDSVLDIITELELKRFIYRSPEGYYH
jgi:DNA processing protein